MTIEFIPAICPKCGGELRVPKNIETIKCMYCGTDIIMQVTKNNPQPNVENWMKLADTIMAGNPEEAYGYYQKVLEVEPENYLAWYGKGHCAWGISTLQSPRFVEMVTCFQKSLEYSPEENKSGRIDIVCLELIQFAFDYYALLSKTYGSSHMEAETIKAYIEKLDFVLSMYDAVIVMFPKFSAYSEAIDLAIQLCTDITTWKITPFVYKQKMYQKISEYKSKLS